MATFVIVLISNNHMYIYVSGTEKVIVKHIVKGKKFIFIT